MIFQLIFSIETHRIVRYIRSRGYRNIRPTNFWKRRHPSPPLTGAQSVGSRTVSDADLQTYDPWYFLRLKVDASSSHSYQVCSVIAFTKKSGFSSRRSHCWNSSPRPHFTRCWSLRILLLAAAASDSSSTSVAVWDDAGVEHPLDTFILIQCFHARNSNSCKQTVKVSSTNFDSTD